MHRPHPAAGCARGVSPGTGNPNPHPHPMTTRRYAPLIVYGTAPATGNKPSTAVEGPSEQCLRGTLTLIPPSNSVCHAACPCSGSRCWLSIHPSSVRAGARALDRPSTCIAGRKRRHARQEQPGSSGGVDASTRRRLQSCRGRGGSLPARACGGLNPSRRLPCAAARLSVWFWLQVVRVQTFTPSGASRASAVLALTPDSVIAITYK